MTAHHPAGADPPPRSKAVLFCTECGHESRAGAGGDWIVRDDHGRNVVDCPECGTRIADRDAVPMVCC